MSHASSHSAGGCGSAACQCAGGGASQVAESEAPGIAMINGIALHDAAEHLEDDALRERAWAELLRQEAVRQGVLPRHPELVAPALSIGDEQAIQAMLERAVPLRAPDEAECLRHFEANRQRFVLGRRAHVRHILFAVTDGVEVNKLAARAEQALLELTRKGAPQGRFAQLASELSNCPSGAEGGDLGWITPEDCAAELVKALFDANEGRQGLGLQPLLVHSRYGFHIIEVLQRQAGTPQAFEHVRDRIAAMPEVAGTTSVGLPGSLRETACHARRTRSGCAGAKQLREPRRCGSHSVRKAQ